MSGFDVFEQLLYSKLARFNHCKYVRFFIVFFYFVGSESVQKLCVQLLFIIFSVQTGTWRK